MKEIKVLEDRIFFLSLTPLVLIIGFALMGYGIDRAGPKLTLTIPLFFLVMLATLNTLALVDAVKRRRELRPVEARRSKLALII